MDGFFRAVGESDGGGGEREKINGHTGNIRVMKFVYLYLERAHSLSPTLSDRR